MNHADLVEAACRWLRGTARCRPVLSGIASAGEIPDAIGWSSSYKHRGSIVVECKTSVADFGRDKNKYASWKHPQTGLEYSGKGRARELAAAGYERIEAMQKMGMYRYFLVPAGMITVAKAQEQHPDHGLLFLSGQRVCIGAQAPRRDRPNLDAEIRLLRFALIHLEHNLLHIGCSVDLTEATKFFGTGGIELPDGLISAQGRA
jgi:hypothetical protein